MPEPEVIEGSKDHGRYFASMGEALTTVADSLGGEQRKEFMANKGRDPWFIALRLMFGLGFAAGEAKAREKQ